MVMVELLEIFQTSSTDISVVVVNGGGGTVGGFHPTLSSLCLSISVFLCRCVLRPCPRHISKTLSERVAVGSMRVIRINTSRGCCIACYAMSATVVVVVVWCGVAP